MAEKLTKAELIDALYESLSPSSRTTRKEIHELIDGLFSEIKGAILEGKIVELRGFGTFEVKLRKGRSKARNPKTGEIVSVSDHVSPPSDPAENSKSCMGNGHFSHSKIIQKERLINSVHTILQQH